jgi:hypothetical protein
MNTEPENLQRILAFLDQIGIAVHDTELSDDTFLPGLTLGPDCIYVDYQRLKYPGDLLHEAGHLCVTTPEQRRNIGTERLELPWPTDGEEIAAVLWSYAAALHVGLEPEVVFHPHGYKNESEWIVRNFREGNYIGLPFLEWAGLALGPQRAETEGKLPFPFMINWKRN